MLRQLTVVAMGLAAGPAHAHHVMGSNLPASPVEGLLSGLGHPVIGVDHLAFVALVGIAAAFTPRRWTPIAAFVLATVAGCLLLASGVGLPLAEIAITGSVVLVGAMIVSGRAFPGAVYAAIFAVSGLFHGWAYGQSIVGAETTPLVAYLVGFALVQAAIALAVGWLVRSGWKAAGPAALHPRLAGAVAAGVGLAFLIENLEGMLLA